MGHEHVVPLPGQKCLSTGTKNGEFLKRNFNRNVRENVSTSLPYAPTAWAVHPLQHPDDSERPLESEPLRFPHRVIGLA